MKDSKNNSVTQSDFMLFKQEMKHEYDLFINNVNNNIKSTIREQINIIGKWVIGFVSVFILAFWTYFEFMSNSLDQLSSERIARMERIEDAILISVNQAIRSKDKKENITNNSPTLNKGKKAKRKGK